jgi:hypothetical protein
VAGSPGRRAFLRLGEGERSQRIASSEMEFQVAEAGGIESATIAAKFVASLHPAAAKDAGSKASVDRIDMVGDGPLVVTGEGATTEGLVRVRGTPASTSTGAARPWLLTTTRLRVDVPSLLAGGAVSLRGLEATGEGTRIDLGAPGAADAVAAVGNRLVYDAATSLATITGNPQALLIQQGRVGRWRTVRLDLETGLPDFEGGRIVIGGDR